jgi:hypothetical protein
MGFPEVEERLSHGAPTWFVRGWIGVRLDNRPDWTEVAEICQDAYRAVAPERLVRLLDAPPTR